MDRSIRLIDTLDGEQYDLVWDHAGGNITPKRKKQKKRRNASQAWYYLGFLGEIGFSISLPIAGGALIGAYLDKLWGTYPTTTLGLLFVGIIVSTINFVSVIRSFTKKER